MSASFSDDEVMNSKLDTDKNYFDNAYPSLAENRAGQYYANETFIRLTAHGTKKNLSIFHVNIISPEANGDVLGEPDVSRGAAKLH